MLKFSHPQVTTNRIHSEIRLSIDGAAMVTNPKGVEVLTDKDNNVTIRGTVADAEEARLVEGLIRLTPGVGTIKNDLKLKAATSTSSR